MKRQIALVISAVLVCLNCYSQPKMVKVPSAEYVYENEKYRFDGLEVSEHKITVGEWEEYLQAAKKDSTDYFDTVAYFEHNLMRFYDAYQEKIVYAWPVWGLTWCQAVEYCNWLSEKENLTKCYTLLQDKDHYMTYVTDYSASGYRLPTVSEWFYLSEIWMNKDASYYESVNILNRKDRNRPCEITEEVKNSFGVYDVLGNIRDMCNSYYDENYSIKDYLRNPYGPETYTPDPDQLYYHETPTEVRWWVGGNYYVDYEFVRNIAIDPINVISDGVMGFRVVRKSK